MALITLDQAIAHDLLFLIQEPKSPQGTDVTPDGRFIVVSGKLDPDVQIYSFDRIQTAMSKRDFKKHPVYGVPILRSKKHG